MSQPSVPFDPTQPATINVAFSGEQFYRFGLALSEQNAALQKGLRQMQWGLRMGSIMPREVERALAALRANMDLIALFQSTPVPGVTLPATISTEL